MALATRIDETRMKLLNNLPALLLATVLLSACGQKGPLYLPDDDPAEIPAGEASQEEDGSTDDESGADNAD